MVDRFIYVWNTFLITPQTFYYVCFFSAEGNLKVLLHKAIERDIKIEAMMAESIYDITKFNLFVLSVCSQ